MRDGRNGQTQNLLIAHRPPASCTARRTYYPGPRIAASNARDVEKRLELVLSGDWTTDKAKTLSSGVRIRVV